MSNVPKLRFKEFSGEWEEKSLGSISKQISYGLTVRPEYIETGIPLISARELRNGKIDYDIASKISEESYNELSEKAKAKKGDIFLTKTGTVGLSAYVNEDFLIAITQNIAVIRVSNENYNHQFILQTFKTQNFYRTAISKVNQSTIMDLQLQDIRKLSVFFPLKEEQEKIASFLISADTKIEQLTKKEELLQKYKKGVMQKIFNQEIRFKDDDGSEFCEWEENKLGEICSIKKGSQLNKDTLTEIGDYPALNGGINPSGYTTDWNTEANTITISEGGNSCGYVNFVRTRFWSGGHNYSLQELENTINPKYLYQYLKFNELNIMKLRVGSGLPNIQKSAISSFNINIPCIEEQNKIANFLSSIDTKIEQVQKQLNFIKEFKKALLHQMFV